MNLTAANQSLELVTSNTNAVAWAVSWTDIDKTGATTAIPGSSQGTVSAATTTVIVPAPPSATIYRIVTGVTVFSSSGAQTVLVQKDVAGTNYPMARGVLAADEALCFEDGAGWYSQDASGRQRTVGSPGANGINGGGTVLGSGTSILDFGSAGSSHVALTVTGQAAILAGSLVFAWLKAEATIDHSADEHVAEDLRAYASNVVASVGFRLHLIVGSYIKSAEVQRRLARFGGTGQDAGPGQFRQSNTFSRGGLAPQVHGKWSVGWLYTQ